MLVIGGVALTAMVEGDSWKAFDDVGWEVVEVVMRVDGGVGGGGGGVGGVFFFQAEDGIRDTEL